MNVFVTLPYEYISLLSINTLIDTIMMYSWQFALWFCTIWVATCRSSPVYSLVLLTYVISGTFYIFFFIDVFLRWLIYFTIYSKNLIQVLHISNSNLYFALLFNSCIIDFAAFLKPCLSNALVRLRCSYVFL